MALAHKETLTNQATSASSHLYSFAFKGVKKRVFFLLFFCSPLGEDNCCPPSSVFGKCKASQPYAEVRTLPRGSTNGFVSRQPTCWGGRGEHSSSIRLKAESSCVFSFFNLGLNLLLVQEGWQESHLLATVTVRPPEM